MAFLSGFLEARWLRRTRHIVGAGLLVFASSMLRCSADAGGNRLGDGDGDSNSGERANIDLTLGYTGGGAGNTSLTLDPLCGVGACVPDDESACEGLGGAGGETAMGGAAGGVNYDPGDLGFQGNSCQVGREPGCSGDNCAVERSCLPAGASGAGQPCVSANDCRAGMACVGEGVSGVCRPYCCLGTERSCAAGTFCDERSLPDAPEIYVPVCLPVDNCSLTDPFPCPEGQDCACKNDRACIVVRGDGATACTVPGAGRVGDPCTAKKTAECAHGFVCSPSAGCMQLCSTVATEPLCPEEGTCQSPSEFPSDLGVCVGVDSGFSAAR